jgi:origin recognition complex subunit 1
MVCPKDEIFFTLDRSSLTNPEQIIRPCLVSKSALAQPSSPSKHARNVVELDGSDSESDDEESRKFTCKLAIDPTRGLYYQFDWLDHRKNAMTVHPGQPEWATAWMVPTLHNLDTSMPQHAEKVEEPARKRRKVGSEGGAAIPQEPRTPSKSRTKSSTQQSQREGSVEYVPGSESEESEDEPLMIQPPEPKTPSRTRRQDLTSVPVTPNRSPRKRVTIDSPSKPKTPGKPRQSMKKIAQPTPHTKARVDRRKLPTVVRAAPPQFASSQQLSPVKSVDPWLRAMNALHVASRPDVLRCREDEYAKVLRSVEQLVEEGSGGCVCK